MELFSEVYNTYFQAVEDVIRHAESSLTPISIAEIQNILSECTFSESAFHILPKLQSLQWALLQKTGDGYTTELKLPDEIPLTTLQKAWLKSILSDSRISLFLDEEECYEMQKALSEIEPLYREEDFYIFDSAADGDDYNSKVYRAFFRAFLTAIRQKNALFIKYKGGKGNQIWGVFSPYKLEYSRKDDRFRAYCYHLVGKRKRHFILNLGRVISVEVVSDTNLYLLPPDVIGAKNKFKEVVIAISRERNALERCLVHFAHFEKKTEYNEHTGKYICTIRYNAVDETEVVIRMLSFGPTIRILEPDEFIAKIRERVMAQSKLISRCSSSTADQQEP